MGTAALSPLLPTEPAALLTRPLPPRPPCPLPAGGLMARDEINPLLNGTLPGDYGYDPLGLAKDAETLSKYQANELLHARWAMLAAAGAIIPEGLAANGADVKGATWFETGAAMLNGGTLNWFAVPIANISNPLPLFVVVAANVALMGAAENYRRTGEGPAGYSPGVGKFDESAYDSMDSLYPGGLGGWGGVGWRRAPALGAQGEAACVAGSKGWRLPRAICVPASAASLPLTPTHPWQPACPQAAPSTPWAWPTTPRCWPSSRSRRSRTAAWPWSPSWASPCRPPSPARVSWWGGGGGAWHGACCAACVGCLHAVGLCCCMS